MTPPEVGPRGEWFLYALCFVGAIAAGAAGFVAPGWGGLLIVAAGGAWWISRRAR